ncbi:hypothetical protein BGZ63DRAFT_409482 [Mariannaea sp. PMI_226]|nr:hypothetical protein BGZ63DRAFT_409482 [Mariannaea sp. PMI_226]
MSHMHDRLELQVLNLAKVPYSQETLERTPIQQDAPLTEESHWTSGIVQYARLRSQTPNHKTHLMSYSPVDQYDNTSAENSNDQLELSFAKRLMGKESSSRLSALGHFSLFHLPAITITLLLLGLYAGHVRWTPPHPTSDELSALQFAAKAHETLILVSLADILLHRILYALLVEDGIPLGFLSSVFNLGSPARYLISWEFWSAMLNPTTNQMFHRFTGVMIIFILLLSMAASPFSATAMIPRQLWYHAEKDFLTSLPQGDKLPAFYISGYPQKLELHSEDVFLGDNRGYCDPEIKISCEAPDLKTILQNFVPIIRNPPVIPLQENITYSTVAIGRNKRPISLSNTAGPAQIALATCPMTFVADAFDAENACSTSVKDSLTAKTATFDFDNGFLDNTTLVLDREVDVAFRKFTEDTELGPRDPLFLDFGNKTIRHAVSAGILFANRLRADKTHTRDTKGGSILALELCLVSARWVDAENWVIIQNSVAVNSNLGFTNNRFLAYLRETATAERVIKVDNGWLEGVGLIVNGHTGLATQLIIPNSFLLLQQCSSDPYPTKEDTIIKNTHYAFAYAYEFQNSMAIPIAFSALLLHVCISLLHIGTILCSAQPWYGLSWGSLGQMLVLALRSRVGDLGNVGGGTSSSQTWRRTIALREVGERHLQLVLKGRDVEDNTDRVGRAPCVKKVQAGISYM